jgi:hypothetical protein
MLYLRQAEQALVSALSLDFLMPKKFRQISTKIPKKFRQISRPGGLPVVPNPVGELSGLSGN